MVFSFDIILSSSSISNDTPFPFAYLVRQKDVSGVLAVSIFFKPVAVYTIPLWSLVREQRIMRTPIDSPNSHKSIMNIRKQRTLILMSSLPLLVSPASFECITNEFGVIEAGAVCCRISQDYGLVSCPDGEEPRNVLTIIKVPEISSGVKALDNVIERINPQGTYGVFGPDKATQDGGNKVNVAP